MTLLPSMPKSVEAVSAGRRWFLGLPTWIRAGAAETNGTLSFIDQIIPPGFTSPWHVHHTEDESFFVVEGTMTVLAGEHAVTLKAGDFAFGPRSVPHGFRIEGSKSARVLLMTNGGNFGAFIHENSSSADSETPPEPNPADLPKLAASAERHGITILGPIPGG